MNTIAYCHPFVPPEWIAAHRLRPDWLRLRPVNGASGTRRGACPAAVALVDLVSQGLSAAAVVLTTTCDQLRYAAALLEHLGFGKVFLMHVPRTWQTAAARSLYREELRRLGRFLVDCGGQSPSREILMETMIRYDQARAELRKQRDRMSARELSEALAWIRGDLTDRKIDISRRLAAADTASDDSSRNLALVGGPMMAEDLELLEIIEHAGGRIVLDATESGERTLPAPFDPQRLRADPWEELAGAYFDAIPDAFRRPNDRLYEWLSGQIAARGVRGILVHRYLWCDLWHAELPRLTENSPVPVLDWEIVGDDPSAKARTLNRLEAFWEML